MLKNLLLVLILNSLVFCEKLFSQLSFTGVSDPWIKGMVYLFDGHQNYGRTSWALAGGFGNFRERSFELKDSTRKVDKGVRVGASVGSYFLLFFWGLPPSFWYIPTNFQVEIGFKISPFREIEIAFHGMSHLFSPGIVDGQALKIGVRFNSSNNSLTRFTSFQVGPTWIPGFWWHSRYKLSGIYSNVDFGYSLTSKSGIGGYIAIRFSYFLRILKKDETSYSRSGLLLPELQFGFHWYFKK